MDRRDFIRNLCSLALLPVVAPLGLGRGPELVPGQTWRSGDPVNLPKWKYGDTSSGDDTVLMFRGNPGHTFYGTGPLPDQLRILWRFQTGEIATTLRGTPKVWSGTGWTGQASVLAGYVFFGSLDGRLYCLRASDGKAMWHYSAGRMFKGSLCIYQNRIYAPNVDDHLHCLDAATGALIWRNNTGRDLDSSPCVVGGKLYVAGESGYVRCIDPEDGRTIWKYFVGGIGPGTLLGSNGAEGSVAVSADDVIVGNYDGEVHCISARTGARKWVAKTGADTDVSPVLDDNHIYIASEEDSPYLYCLDRKTGRIVWKYGNTAGWYSTPALVEQKLYVGGNCGTFFCLNAKNGDVIWRYRAEAPIWSSPVVVGGRVLFGTYGNHIVILSAESGKELQSIDLEGRVLSTPCVVDGKVFIGTATGWFYALGHGEGH